MESSRELQCFTTSLPSAAGPIASPLPSSLFFYPSPPHHSFTSLVQQSSRPSSSQPSDPARPSFSSRGGRVVVEIPRSSQPSSSKEEEKEEVLLPLDLYQEEERSGDHRSNIIGSGRERFVSSNSQSRPSPRRRRKPLPPPSTSLPPSSTCSTLPFQPLSTPDPSSTAPPLPLLPIGWSAGEWSCENPFIGEIPFKPEYTSERRATPAEFLLIQSAEESRTSQACQACRIRKSKCDGKHSCIRCEKKGLCCVYTTRPIRPRGKRPNKTESRFSSSSSSSLSSSCTSGHHHPLSPPRIIFKSEREVTPAEKESIGGKWEGEVEGWRDEVRSGSMGAEGARGEWRSTMDVEDGEFSHRIEVEGSHRLQLSEDHHSISPFAAAVPLETSHPTTPPSYNPSKLHQSYTSYPTPSYGQHFQPPPHPSQNQLSLPRRPPSSPGYPPTVRSSEDQINSPFLNYYLVAVSSPIHQLQYPPSFDTQPSYAQSDRRDASSSFVVGPLSSSRFSAHPEQKQQYFSQSTGQELSSSRTQDSSSRWNLGGGEERKASTSWPSTFGGPGTLTPAPSVWDGDEWSKLGFSG